MHKREINTSAQQARWKGLPVNARYSNEAVGERICAGVCRPEAVRHVAQRYTRTMAEAAVGRAASGCRQVMVGSGQCAVSHHIQKSGCLSPAYKSKRSRTHQQTSRRSLSMSAAIPPSTARPSARRAAAARVPSRSGPVRGRAKPAYARSNARVEKPCCRHGACAAGRGWWWRGRWWH